MWLSIIRYLTIYHHLCKDITVRTKLRNNSIFTFCLCLFLCWYNKHFFLSLEHIGRATASVRFVFCRLAIVTVCIISTVCFSVSLFLLSKKGCRSVHLYKLATHSEKKPWQNRVHFVALAIFWLETDKIRSRQNNTSNASSSS